ncbi:hypothetical protein U3A55_15015 [Salarchaeum sp. III]
MFEQMDRAFDDVRTRWNRSEAGEPGAYSGLDSLNHRMTHD